VHVRIQFATEKPMQLPEIEQAVKSIGAKKKAY
jgi:hypothetical protein